MNLKRAFLIGWEVSALTRPVRAVNFFSHTGTAGIGQPDSDPTDWIDFRSGPAVGGLGILLNTKTRENIGIEGTVVLSADNCRLTKLDLTWYW